VSQTALRTIARNPEVRASFIWAPGLEEYLAASSTAPTSNFGCVFGLVSVVVGAARSPEPPQPASRTSTTSRTARRRIALKGAHSTLAQMAADQIEDQLKRLPTGPGVYIFRNAKE